MKKLSFLFLVLPILVVNAFGDCLCRNQVLGQRLSMVTEPQSQTNSSLQVDPSSGRYFMAWQENGRIKGRLFGPHGAKTGPIKTFAHNTAQPGNWVDSFPLVSFNTVGSEYFVIWHSTLVDANFNTISFELRGARVSSTGAVTGSFAITTKQIAIRQILFNTNSNEYAVLYSPFGHAGIQPKLFVQRMDKSGMFVAAPMKISSPSGSALIQTDFTLNTQTNRYLVTWTTSTARPSIVQYAVFTGNLAKIGGIRAASLTPSVQPGPVAIYDVLRDRFLLLWKGTSNLNAIAISSTGLPAGPPVSLGHRGALTAAYDSTTGSLLLGYLGSNGGLFLARINPSLKPIGDDFLASCQLDRRIGLNPIHALFNPVSHVFLVVWPYVDASPTSWDIYGQQVRGQSIGQCS